MPRMRSVGSVISLVLSLFALAGLTATAGCANRANTLPALPNAYPEDLGATTVVAGLSSRKFVVYRTPENSTPVGVAYGIHGGVWFTELIGNSIGEITPAGQLQQFPIGGGVVATASITADSHGDLWFEWATQSNASGIGRILENGTVTLYPVTNVCFFQNRNGIAVGSDGNIWFTDYCEDKISRLTPAGKLTQFTVPGTIRIWGITAGPDGNLWFSDTGQNRIGRITPGGVITEFPVDWAPVPIASGTDGMLYAGEWSGRYSAHIAQITTDGIIHEYPIKLGEPTGLAMGSDQQIWIVGQHSNLERFNPVTHVASNPIPLPDRLKCDCYTDGIARGQSDQMWIANADYNQIDEYKY